MYDVCQVIICKTAKRESWINIFVMNGREEKDVEQIDQTLKDFTAVDQRWNILTSSHPKKGILLSKLYVEFLQNTVCTDNEMNFEEYISTPDLLRSRICEWYFESINISDTECFNKLLLNEDLEDSVRLKLYEFITLPDEYIRTIRKSMHHVSVEMEEFYQKNNNVLEKRKNDFKYFERQQEKLLFS